MRKVAISKVSIPVGYSAIARPIDPSYPSNILAVAVAGASALLFAGYNLVAVQELASSWVEASVGVFLAWAIGRELDPDRNLSAALAMAIAFLAALVAAPSLLSGLGVLIAVRLVTGSAGVQLKILDMVALIGLGALLGTGSDSIAVLPGLAVGVLILEERSRRGVLLAALLTLSGVVAAVVSSPWSLDRHLAARPIAIAAMVLIALAMIVPAPSPHSTADIGDKPLVRWRITAARVVAAVTLLATLIVSGGAGVEAAFGTGGAAIIGVAVAKFFPQESDPE